MRSFIAVLSGGAGRVTPNPNRSSSHLFLHWVERGGKYQAHAFDAVRVAEVRQRQGVR